MKFEQVLQLVNAVSVSALTEFKYEEGGVKISMKKAAEGNPEQGYCVPGIAGQVMRTEAGTESAGMRSAGADSTGTDTVGTDGTKSVMAADASASKERQETESAQVVKSPLVGTFYAAPSEDAKPFVRVGDKVEKGQVLAIVEAMKLMNEIESDFGGEVVKILAENGEAVEYGQPLFVIKE